MSRVTVNCDVCAEDITGDYFPGVERCDNCTDQFGIDGEPESYAEFCNPMLGDAGDIFETESLADCMADISGGLSTAPWY